jgi:hypothetical protein
MGFREAAAIEPVHPILRRSPRASKATLDRIGSCSNCAADLSAPPAVIEWDDLTATATEPIEGADVPL